MRPRQAAAGLDPYFEGLAADRITDELVVGEFEAGPPVEGDGVTP